MLTEFVGQVGQRADSVSRFVTLQLGRIGFNFYYYWNYLLTARSSTDSILRGGSR